ncbi:MAG TPA: SpoIID/LytB domain-containing protein [Gaiellaceae bacterium]|nr:SpoIID/LytB domain-containing protein [Gaiellaceae bacterium]
MSRRALFVVAVIALALGASASARRDAAAPPAQSATFFVSGRGWGHGVGLSQWGAYGFAQRGSGYEAILAHYYRGTQLGRAPVARIRVLLGEGRKSVTVKSSAPFRLRDGSGQLHQLAAGAYTFGPGLRVKVDPAAEPRPLASPLLFTPGAAPLEYGKPYRGQLQVNAGSNSLQVVNHVGLEPYLYGVVPREVPSAWPVEALKAQAVVARSYALAVRKTGSYDVYADTRSQVYGGLQAEKPTTNAAVDATAGQVLLYEGKVATTFFFSTSGGRTANVADVWAGGEPTPYLVSVPDPYDSASPHHAWGPVLLTQAKLAKTFRIPGQIADVRADVNPSQRVDSLTFVTQRGDELSFKGADVRTRLGLRSTWFRVGLIALDKPKAIEYGKAARLTGRVRGSASVTLQQRAGAIWEPASRPKPNASGAIGVAVKPLVSTDYRLSVSPSIAGAAVRVSVAPRVRFQAVTEQTTLRGVVRPVLPGARVDIQRLAGNVWRTVSTTSVDASGAFAASLSLTPGSYRARVAASRGFVAGVSPVLKVVQ